jgi:osmotically inducible protein OsmC
MKKIRRTASAFWKSGANGGTRSISTESGALSLAQFTVGKALKSNPCTNPGELGSSADTVGEITTTATVNSEELEAGWTITDIHLNVDAKLPKVTQGQFIDAAVHAKTACMVCRLLRTNISMNAKLDLHWA